MNDSAVTIYVVDDDVSVRRSLKRLLNAYGFQMEVFSSASEFLNSKEIRRPACLVLDVQLPDTSGINLQAEMRAKGLTLPIVFITGHGDISMSVKAMKAGAVDFLPKPFSTKSLVESVERALSLDQVQMSQSLKMNKVKVQIEALTPREKEVFLEVIKGKLNKQIAHDLGIALKTVKIHRGNVMRKMKAHSVIGLAQMAREAGITL